MKLLLEVEDSKALHLIEVLKGLKYVKTKALTEEKATLMTELKEASTNLKLIKQGKLKGKSARMLLNEV